MIEKRQLKNEFAAFSSSQKIEAGLVLHIQVRVVLNVVSVLLLVIIRIFTVGEIKN